MIKTPTDAEFCARRRPDKMASGPLEHVLTTTAAITAAAVSSSSAASGVSLILNREHKLIPSLIPSMSKPTDMAAVDEYAVKVHAARTYLMDLKATLAIEEEAVEECKECKDLLQEIIPKVSARHLLEHLQLTPHGRWKKRILCKQYEQIVAFPIVS